MKMISENSIVLDGVEINDTAEVEQSSGVWSPIPKRFVGMMYAEGIMLPIRQVKYVLPAGAIILCKYRRVTAIANENVSYEVNEAEYRQALIDQDDDTESAFEMIQMSKNTVRITYESDLDDITMTHSCSVEEE
ncbi:MAG: hypothetical protein ACJAS1_005847 [Oleiphilaceae bacterium]|jgi:hypothetical protein